MGENLHDDVAGEAEDSRQRRLKMIAAVEGDDWSEVISQQTAEAAGGAAPGQQGQQVQAGESGGAPVTPFARASVHRAVGNAADGEVCHPGPAPPPPASCAAPSCLPAPVCCPSFQSRPAMHAPAALLALLGTPPRPNAHPHTR